MSAVAIFCAVLVISPLVLILIHLLRQGVTSLNWAFLTELPKPVGEAGWRRYSQWYPFHRLGHGGLRTRRGAL